MADTIRGPVTRVVDGDTFEMKVTHIGKENTEEYNDSEIVRIAGIDAPELATAAGKKAKVQLDKELSGKTVRCQVRTRDTYGRVVAAIEIL